jgi:DNA-binding GntR family transcriptional regulator
VAGKDKSGRASSGGRVSDIVDVLRDRIARQEVAPGARLREQELAVEFDVPRTRIRDAFAVLEGRGLIDRVPNRGAVVARLDLSHVFHIYDVREVLEGLSVRLATENVGPDRWQDLVDHFDEPMGRHVDEGDYDSFLDGYARFRSRVAEAAANPVLADMLDSIYEKTQALIRRIIILPGRAEVGLAEHRGVLEAMRAGDAALAEERRRSNMRSAKEFLRRYERFVL